MKKKIFIIGSKGQLGSCIRQALNKKYQIIDGKLLNFNILTLNKKIKILKKISPILIINCSAYTDVDLNEKLKKKAKKLNFLNVKDLIEICKKLNVKLIHFSTDYVYGNLNKFHKEDDICFPINYYGKTKYMGDQSIISSKINFLIFRICFLLSKSKKSFVYKIKHNLKLNKKVYVIYDAYTSATTDIFVKKFFNKNIKKILNSGINGVYNLRNKGIKSYYNFAIEIARKINKTHLVNKISYNDYKFKATRPKYSKLNIKKAMKVFKIPANNWKEDLKKY